ncbi:hypothetical protein LMG27952_04895 [Paraburkholderia hiiakae]|uniref:Uncharacterized protein n=1 Tax=Paraburkholderia hiiakae TaxID=1081782 RepID=A0ABN7I4I6_9BURK|nr:hypothetical protein [Paraburkholderia hiiakae]CAD6549733.1 hypothetical protein LMG27952_04895 [Paraburkholderia hiiakae]
MTVKVRSYLEDFGDVKAAYAEYIADLQQGEEAGDVTSGICARLSLLLNSRVHDLNQRFARGEVPKCLDARWTVEAYVFVGDADGKFFTVRQGSQIAVLIDADLLLRLVAFIYLVGLDREDDQIAQCLSAFMLLSIVVPRPEPIEFMGELLAATSREKQRVLNDIFVATSSFLVFHELGHSYGEATGTIRPHLKLSFGLPEGLADPDSVQSLKYHADGTLYNRLDIPGTTTGMLVINPVFEHWRDEFSADAFAAYAHVLTSSDGRPGRGSLDQLASAIECWQLVLFAIGSRERYVRAISEVREIESVSHPQDHVRMDVLAHHLDHIALDFVPDWQSHAVGLLHIHYQSLWAADMRSLLDDGVEYVRYAFDEDGPHINDGRLRTFTGQPVRYSPSALSKLKAEVMDPFLTRAEQIGWDKAVSERQKEDCWFFGTFKLNGVPIILKLGRRLRDVGVRLISEDRV